MRRISKILTAGMLVGALTLTTAVGCKDRNDGQTADTKDETTTAAEITTMAEETTTDEAITTVEETTTAEETTTDEAAVTTAEETTTAAEKPEDAADIADSLELLNTVWESYGEEDKFSAAGGDYAEENSVVGAPGNFGLSDAEVLDSVLALPADCVSMIDNAASLTHMMNANTFTGGAFHVTEAENVSVVAEKLKNNVMERQWMCGFPDKLLIVTVENYVVSAFGNEELIGTFKDRLSACYPAAEVVYEQAIQ